MITINIGSAIKGVNKALHISTVFNRLEAIGLTPFQFRTEESNTETTYIICIHGPVPSRVIHDLSIYLHQDAIAYYDHHSSVGHLVGPKAADWGGAFNPAYFLEY